MDFDRKLILPIVLVAVGIAIIVIGAYLAFKEFVSYKPNYSSTGSIEQSISNTINEVINLVVKIAFIAAAIWAGSVLVKYGARSYVDFNKPPKVVKIYVRGKKRSS